MHKLVAMLQSAPPAATPAAGADEPMLEKMDFYHVGAAPASEAEVYLLALLLVSTGLCDDELNSWAAVVVEIGAQYKDQAELWRPPTAKGEATRWARPQLQMASAAKAGKRALSRAGEALGKLLPDVGAPSESSLLTWSGGINRAPNRRPLNGPEDGSKHPLRRHIHAMVPVANLIQRDLALLRREYDAATGVLLKSKTPTKAELLEAAEAAVEVAEKSQRAADSARRGELRWKTAAQAKQSKSKAEAAALITKKAKALFARMEAKDEKRTLAELERKAQLLARARKRARTLSDKLVPLKAISASRLEKLNAAKKTIEELQHDFDQVRSPHLVP
jgi:hypothetical protein